MSIHLFGDDPLAMTNADVARLTRSQREARVTELIDYSRSVLSDAIERHVWSDGRMVAATAVMFSGGNDSTVLAHMFRHDVDCAVHANTTIGIEQTRDFVRNTCEEWGLSLIERIPPREVDRYRHLVLTRQRGKRGQALGGFPGPAMHFKMYARLKQRVFEQVQRELVSNPRRERVVFLAGRRRDESQRRRQVPESERRGSAVWVSPLVHWTKLDLTTYRLMVGNVPTNEVSDTLHMSGECLCGAMASPGEREEIAYWFPGPFDQIAELEAILADRDDIPTHRKKWGWGADPAEKAAEDAYLALYAAKDDVEEPMTSPFLCASCDDRFQAAFDFEEIA